MPRAKPKNKLNLTYPIWESFLTYLSDSFLSKVQYLLGLGSTFGLPMKFDAATVAVATPSVSRICIKMDL